MKFNIREFVKKESVLIISGVLAIVTSFFLTPKVEYIDFKVLILLFNLMIVVAALKNLKVLDKCAVALLKRCTTSRKVNMALIFTTFIASMLVTNDVSLITFVPLTIIIGKRANIKVLKTVVFQTLAANLGSTLTPMGNPQNLFIYSHYNMAAGEFFKITLPIIVLGIFYLIFIIFKEKSSKINFEMEEVKIQSKWKVVIISMLFLIILLSVFTVVNYKVAFALTIITILLLDKNLFFKVDYSLLLTFVAFFIFIGNVSCMENIKSFMENLLNSGKNTYFAGVLCSQIISNVPATMLISKFTSYSKELLLSVNIGGMGTLIASLASLISYKLYLKEYEEDNSSYLKTFTVYNLIGLAIFVPTIYFLFIR